jgi:hypothetical protein
MSTPPPGIPTSTNGTLRTGDNDKVCFNLFSTYFIINIEM